MRLDAGSETRVPLIWLVNDRSPIGSDASGAVDPVVDGGVHARVDLVDLSAQLGRVEPEIAPVAEAAERRDGTVKPGDGN